MRSLATLLALSLLCSALGGPAAEQVALQTDGPAHTTESWEYNDCGRPSDIVQIESISIEPDPPKPGQELTVTVTAQAVERIEEGAYADVAVKLGLIKLIQKRFDLCKEAQNLNTTLRCPVDEGLYTVKQSVTLPKEIPQAKYTVNVRGYTASDDDMVCLDLKVDFMKRPWFKLGL